MPWNLHSWFTPPSLRSRVCKGPRHERKRGESPLAEPQSRQRSLAFEAEAPIATRPRERRPAPAEETGPLAVEELPQRLAKELQAEQQEAPGQQVRGLERLYLAHLLEGRRWRADWPRTMNLTQRARPSQEQPGRPGPRGSTQWPCGKRRDTRKSWSDGSPGAPRPGEERWTRRGREPPEPRA